MDMRTTVLDLLRTLKPPVHLATLSTAYKQRMGRSMKADAKMSVLHYVREKLTEDVVIEGAGNDTFMRVATPTTRTSAWVRACIHTNGPILASMVGRLYREAHGEPFAEKFPEGVGRFMRKHLVDELTFEAQKGQEVLVDVKRRGETRSFIDERSKKLRKADRKRERPDGAVDGAADGAAEGAEEHDDRATTGAVAGVRLFERGSAGAYVRRSERILVVGEADFSWAASLVRAPLSEGSSRKRLTCTSYDSWETLQRKYGGGIVQENVEALRAAGASVVHEVDATAVSRVPKLRARGPFDIVVFHFPHTGTDGGLTASIAENRALLRAFLADAADRSILGAEGEVHITLVHRYPYTAWLAAVGARSAHGQPAPGSEVSAAAARATAPCPSPTETAVAAAKRAVSEAAKAASRAAKALKEACSAAETAAAEQAKAAAREQARAAAQQLQRAVAAGESSAASQGTPDDIARASDGSSREVAPPALAYAGAVPFDFGAFPGYSHQATTRVEGGALDVATRCLTHVWRRSGGGGAVAASALAGVGFCDAPTAAARAAADEAKPPSAKRQKKHKATRVKV